MTQPPILPANASRAQIRTNGVTQFSEESKERFNRVAANEYIKSLANARIHVIDCEHLFVTPSGQVPFVDDAGNQIFQDRRHLSAFGAAMPGKLLQEKILDLVKSQ